MGIQDMAKATKAAKGGVISKACRPFFVDLSAYSDGELEGEAKAAIEHHLLVCEECRLRLDQMIHLRYQALRVLATPGLPRGRSLLDLLKASREDDEEAERVALPGKPLVS